MNSRSRIVKLGDGTSIEIATGDAFRPAEESYTGVVQSVLYVFNDKEFNAIGVCEVYFKSFGRDFGDLCEDGQLGLDEFVATCLDGNEAIRIAPSLLVSKSLLQGARGDDEPETLLGSYEFCGYWLFVHQFEDGKKVASQMTLGCPDLFSLVDWSGFVRHTPSARVDWNSDCPAA